MRCKAGVGDWVNLLLLTLHLAGGEITGRTRLQKLAFLVLQRLNKRAGSLPPELKRILCLEFKPANYGPYSRELARDAVEYATDSGLIIVERPVDKPERYALTEYGARKGEALCRKLEARGLTLDDEIRELARMSLPELVKLVYDTYPEYTIKSRIKERLAQGAVVAWAPLEEGDIELIEDMEREGHIKAQPTLFLDWSTSRDISLADGLVRVSVRLQGKRPRITILISPPSPGEYDSRS